MKPGIYENMTFADYQLIDARNWSKLKHMTFSPRHYLAALTDRKPSTVAQIAGQPFHCALLEANRWAGDFVVIPDNAPRKPTEAQWNAAKPSDNSRASMEWWSIWNKATAGAETIEREDQAQAQAMADAVRRDPIAAEFLKGARTELTMVWNDPRTGILCKGRADILGRALCDAKGTVSIDKWRFDRECARNQYFGQLAHYSSGVEALGIKVLGPPCIIACEIGPAHDVGVFRLQGEDFNVAMDEYNWLMDQLAECLKSGKWPGRYREIQSLTVPNFETQVEFENV